jgi:hypothetical protein
MFGMLLGLAFTDRSPRQPYVGSASKRMPTKFAIHALPMSLMSPSVQRDNKCAEA